MEEVLLVLAAEVLVVLELVFLDVLRMLKDWRYYWLRLSTC